MEANDSVPRSSLFSKKQLRSCPNDPSLPLGQIGSMNDFNLGNLREGIKNAMIPLLIKVFELKLAAQQAKTPPSRLQKQPSESIDKIREQLSHLLKDLDLLHLWCESSQKQILKALKEIEETHHNTSFNHTASSDQKSNPAIERSFSEAVASQNFSSTPSFATELPIPPTQEISEVAQEAKTSWLRKFFPW